MYARKTALIRGLKPWAWYTLLLSLASVCVFGQVAASPGSQVYAGNDDSSLFIWWIGHGAEVLSGKLGFGPVDGDFLYTHEMNALSGGVNGAWNTSLLGISLVLAPLTWVAGPIVSYNLLILAIPVLNGLATAVLFRRFLDRIPAFVSAGMAGFSSYVVAQLAGHPNLAFAIAPPLVGAAILVLLGPGTPHSPGSAHAGEWEGWFWRQRRFWTVSVGLGLLLGFQFYVSTEVLAGTFLAALCFTLCLFLFDPRTRVPRSWLRLGIGGLLASAIALLAALPLLLTMRGENAPVGAIRPHGVWNTDLLDLIVPAGPTLIGAGSSPIPRVEPLDLAEIGGYLGLPALVAAFVIVIGLRRSSRILGVAAATGSLIFILSLGSPVFVGGRTLLDPGPFVLIEQIAVLNNLLPMRLVLHSTIAVFAILGYGLQWALANTRSRRGRGLIALLMVSAFFVIPGSQTAREVYVPEFYSRSIDEVIPQGALVKTLPRPVAWAEPHADEAMVWQAVSGFRYRETGGYFIGSSPESDVVYSAPQDSLDLLVEDSLLFSDAGLPDPDSAASQAAFEDLRSAGVDYLVLAPDSPLLDQERTEEFFDRGLGEPIFSGEGVRVYRLDR